MITCASGSASTSGHPTTSSAHPQSHSSDSISRSVAVSAATSSAQTGSVQTSRAVYMTPESVQRRPDGTHLAYSEAGGSFSGMPGSGASSSGMSAGGPSG